MILYVRIIIEAVNMCKTVSRWAHCDIGTSNLLCWFFWVFLDFQANEHFKSSSAWSDEFIRFCKSLGRLLKLAPRTRNNENCSSNKIYWIDNLTFVRPWKLEILKNIPLIYLYSKGIQDIPQKWKFETDGWAPFKIRIIIRVILIAIEKESKKIYIYINVSYL